MLTAKQQQTYQFIKHYMQSHGYAPTEAEIAAGIGITSTGTVHRYVTALAAAGCIEIAPDKRRNIRLVDVAAANVELPIMGKIAAGYPIEAINAPQFLNISAHVLGENRFVLQVVGDSMIGDNICDGDYIICEKAQTARKGAIVIALIDGQEATLKRLHPNPDGTISLIPSNPRLSALVYAAYRVQIQGIYIGLLRLSDIAKPW
jgi:repressor LexA